jgi:hypothetical protein
MLMLDRVWVWSYGVFGFVIKGLGLESDCLLGQWNE